MILRMCRGQDDSLVVDDHGGLPKTVSVENSFRRGTVCSLVSVEEAMETLYERLPIIYNNRTDYSDRPEKAFPRTLRLTIRNVDSSLSKSKRRPFATRSKQTILSNGAHFHQLSGEGKLPLMLKILVQPLMRSLLVNESINVTRINVAITDFQDISVAKGPSTFISSHSQRSPKPSQVRQVELPSMLHKKRSKRIDDYFAPRKKHA